MLNLSFVSQFEGDLGIPIHAREFAHALDKRINVNRFQIGKPMKGLKSPIFTFWYPNTYSQYATDIGYFVFEYEIIPKSLISEINNLKAICTPSMWAKHILEKNNIHVPIHVIPGGVNGKSFNSKYKNLPTDYFSFLHIGKAERRKGTRLLIESFNEAFKGDPKIQLTLSIDNPHIKDFSSREYLYNIKLKYPITNITLFPHLSSIEMLYRTHHVAVFPTMAEGIGLPIVEAMACGMPVIVSNNTGITEYANDCNAILLKNLVKEPVYDPDFFPNSGEFGEWNSPTKEELIEKMLWVYNNYDAATQIGKKAEIDMKEYSWNRSASIFIREVLNG